MEVLILSKRKALCDLSKMVSESDTCYYLCDDYITLTKIKSSLDNNSDILTLGGAFHKSIKEIEKDYLYFCHKINFRNRSEVYWGSALASRNSASVSLLKYLVYFQCAKNILSHASSRIIFVCDSPALIKSIQNVANERGFFCQVNFLPSEFLCSLKIYAKIFLRGMLFLTSGILRWIYARSLKNERIDDQPNAGRIVLRSWVTAGNIDNEGQYIDRNFGVLPEYMDQQGKDVWILPMFFNLDKSIFAQMKLMAQSSRKFIFPEQYISILDLLKTLRDGVKTILLDLDGIEFKGQDLGQVVKEVHLESCLSPQLVSLNLVKYLIKAFAKNEIGIERFIYPIENNAPEKPFILAVRKYYPDSKVVGFQHTVWYKEQLGMSLHPEELDYHPMPNQIICSGSRYLDILQESGFPGKILSLGPSLRFTAVNQSSDSNYDNVLHKGKMILIILNFDTNQIMEMLEKVNRALPGLDDVKIYIKAHPDTPLKKLEKFCSDIEFPDYEWATGTVLEWVVRASVVIMTGGSVSNLEAMATGVPLLRVSLENNFDFDPLWDQYPFPEFLNSPHEISMYLKAAFQISLSDQDRLLEFGKVIVKEYFEPTTSDNLRVFL